MSEKKHFLEYSNRTNSNIIPKDSFDDLVQEVFGIISTNIAKSLGPLGSSTVILDGMLTSTTKDGHAIFKSFRFHNRYKNMIYNLIKAPCTRLNNTVGDGTTTAIVLTNYLFQYYQKMKYGLDCYYRLPRTFVQTWDHLIEEIVEKIKGYATPLNPDDYDLIYSLSYIASNGNSEICKNIADTYKDAKSPVIKLKNSPTNKSYITPIIGFEFPANLIDQAYVRNEDLSTEEKDICVMIFDYKIEADICLDFIIPMNEVLKAQGKKLLVLAPYYDAHLSNTTLKSYMNQEYQKYKSLNLILAQYAIGKLDDYQLLDLSTVLRAIVINQDIGRELLDGSGKNKFSGMTDGEKYEFVEEIKDTSHRYHGLIGTAATALLSCTNGSIFRVNDIETDERYMDMLRSAEKELQSIIGRTDNEKQGYAFEISKAQARISQLKMENYLYYIGSDSALQTNIIWDSVEDVVKCIRSAIKSGTVPGCQLSIVRACMELTKEIGSDITDMKELTDSQKLEIGILQMIQDAVINVYRSVLHGPEGRGMIKLVPMWQHIREEGADDLIKEANSKCDSIIEESVIRNEVFDLETLKHNPKIITSAETDTMILIACSELIKLLISGNQCVFLDAEINNAHDEEAEAYV